MLTLKQAEKKLEDKFLNKHVRFTYPSYLSVTGKIDAICIDTAKLPAKEVIFQMNDKRYSVSLESLFDCLKLL